MAKAYWVVCYRSISDSGARDAYTKLAVPAAVLASGGRFLARGLPVKTYGGGIDQRTVLVEFDSLAQAIAAHDSPGYQAALAVLGNAAERDLRIVEGYGWVSSVDQTPRSGRFPSMTEALHTAEVAIPRKLTLSRSLGLAHGDGSRPRARYHRDFLGHQSQACAFAVVETTRSQQCPV